MGYGPDESVGMTIKRLDLEVDRLKKQLKMATFTLEVIECAASIIDSNSACTTGEIKTLAEQGLKKVKEVGEHKCYMCSCKTTYIGGLNDIRCIKCKVFLGWREEGNTNDKDWEEIL